LLEVGGEPVEILVESCLTLAVGPYGERLDLRRDQMRLGTEEV
jgi:hypothetical protein